MIAPARIAAYGVLMAVSGGKADLPTAIARAREDLSDERDRAMVADIATGVQRWRARLDHLLAVFSKRPLERLDPEIVEILRLGAYQLLYHSRVPASAVVDDAVNLAGLAGKRSAAGFVNAVLRTVSRRRSSLPLPSRPLDPTDRTAALDYFAVSLSHPHWLAARWYDRVGFDAAESWMVFNNTPARLTLRANRLRLNRDQLADRLAGEHIVVRPGLFAPEALIVEEGQPLGGRAIYEGLCVVQDEASQLVSLLAGPDPGERVLDTCASPGGKTTALAAAMRDRGLLVACDVRTRRMELLERAVAASGATHVRLVQADLKGVLPFTRSFDCVLVDAPCSGLGTLRRDPDIRWRRTEADLPALAATQTAMLGHAADTVRTGGRLVYATCSSEPEENESVAELFLATHADFSPVDARSVAPSLPAAVVDSQGHLRTIPFAHGLEAFFGAVFERRA
jgi:16S rRNA (cytosine967-C5)-methyltransferase